MLRSLFVILLFCSIPFIANCQKPAIDLSAVTKWPSVGNCEITADGKYVMYCIITSFNEQVKYDLILQSSDNSWKIKTTGVKPYSWLSGDSKNAIFQTEGDSLIITRLGTSQTVCIPNTHTVKYPNGDSAKWLAYTLKDDANTLRILNLHDNIVQSFEHVESFDFSRDGQDLLLVIKKNKESLSDLQWINLQTGKTHTCWHGTPANNFQFNQTKSKLGFLSSDAGHHPSLWLYTAGTGEATCLIDGDTLYVHQHLVIKNIGQFNADSDRLQIILNKQVSSDSAAQKKPLVVVWKSTDPMLVSQKESAGKKRVDIKALVSLKRKEIQFIQREHESWLDISGSVILLKEEKDDNDYSEWYWNPACHKKLYIWNNETGKKELVTESNANIDCSLSPDGRFVVYFHHEKNKYFFYETKTGQTRSTPAASHINWLDTTDPSPIGWYNRTLPIGWIPEENSVLLRDVYDIWKIDCMGKHPPVNLTRGLGNTRHLVFDLMHGQRHVEFQSGDRILLTVFDVKTKNSGFYRVTPDGSAQPQKLTWGPYAYTPDTKKASLDSSYIVIRMTASNSPNLFFTRDFKSFTRLSHLEPEKKYNWLTTELISWINPDGRLNQGILYKPEDFNPHKKYPVIFYYYEKLSNDLNKFQQPGLSDGMLNIPWMVSRGYLIFTPDIFYTRDQPGKNACDAVVSAAQHLLERPYVDKDRMGLHGHSFGGFETNYIVTHTHLFAAACSAAGLSDFTAEFGTLWRRGSSRQGAFEHGQNRMSGTPWQKKEIYVSNSPIYFADHITTPLLIFANRQDEKVEFTQGLSLFLALRRLQKKAWMLEYPGEGHSLDGTETQIDFTKKLTEFFDHFLLQKPVPDWMKP